MIRGVPLFWVAPGFLSTCFGYSQIFGYIFGYRFIAIPGFLGIICLVKFDFFKNNPDFWVLLLIFYDIVECCLQGSLFLIFFSEIQLILVGKNGNNKRIECLSMIPQFSFPFYYACAKSSILSITAISLS